MWSARGAYRNTEGRIVQLPERSPLWVSREGLLDQVQREHPSMEWAGHGLFKWCDNAGVERFIHIEECE